jgi:hypothetical protein
VSNERNKEWLRLHGSRDDEQALRGLDGYEQMLDTFAQQAKAYWRLWGPLGEPMVRTVDGWTKQQHSYLRWVRENHAEERRP